MTNPGNPFDTLADHALAEQRAGRTIPLDSVRREVEADGPAPDAGHAAEASDDEPWRILSEWIGSGTDAHAAMQEMAAAGYVIVSQKNYDNFIKPYLGVSVAPLETDYAARPDGAR